MNSDIYTFSVPSMQAKEFKNFGLPNTLTITALFSVDCKFQPPQDILYCFQSLSDAHLLFANTMSSAYLMHGTPLFRYSRSELIEVDVLPAMVIDFHLVVGLPL